MSHFLFCLGAFFLLFLLLLWGFRTLPRENWQFLASVPRKHLADGSWEGENLTYYGLFQAIAHVIALFFFLLLTASIKVSLLTSCLMILILMLFCLPASRILAQWIEKKHHNLTVSGAFFTGLLFAPLSMWISYQLTLQEGLPPFAPLCCAMMIAYAFGEGIGRLACISFGCCYGKPIGNAFATEGGESMGFVFWGKTKKISYASDWEGLPVWPVQAYTAILFVLAALIAVYYFFEGYYRSAFLFTLIITQLWRIISEFLRGDYRGGRRFSMYQVFSLLAIFISVIFLPFIPEFNGHADLKMGLYALWNVPVILFLEGWAVLIFWYTGRSRVTGSQVFMYVKQEKI